MSKKNKILYLSLGLIIGSAIFIFAPKYLKFIKNKKTDLIKTNEIEKKSKVKVLWAEDVDLFLTENKNYNDITTYRIARIKIENEEYYCIKRKYRGGPSTITFLNIKKEIKNEN